MTHYLLLQVLNYFFSFFLQKSYLSFSKAKISCFFTLKKAAMSQNSLQTKGFPFSQLFFCKIQKQKRKLYHHFLFCFFLCYIKIFLFQKYFSCRKCFCFIIYDAVIIHSCWPILTFYRQFIGCCCFFKYHSTIHIK